MICDDCSADFNREEVEAFVRQCIRDHEKNNISGLVVYKQEKNVGVTANAQKGIELSSGMYFKLHAGDDMLYGQSGLTRICREFFKPDVQVVTGRAIACMPNGEMTSHINPSEHNIVKMKKADAYKQFELMVSQPACECVSETAIFWRRQFFDQIGGFDLSYRYLNSWPLCLKIAASGQRIVPLDIVTTIYRYGGCFNCNNALNLILKKQYYRECVRMFREIAIPFLKQNSRKRKILRGKQCIRCLQAHIDIDGEWYNWTLCKQAFWKMRNWKYLIFSWIYKILAEGISIRRKTKLMIMFVCVLLYHFNVEIWPGVQLKKLWVVLFSITLLWLIVQECGYRVVRCLNLLLNFMRG